MLLDRRNAIIYGGGGAIGGAIARAFAREGARVALAGRTRARLEAVAREAGKLGGGTVDVAEVDALDPRAVEAHADDIAAKFGSIDVAVNAVGFHHVQGTPLGELSLADFSHPVEAYTRTNFVTAKAVARHMVAQGQGVILTLSLPGSRLAGSGFLGNGAAFAAVEAMSRLLAAELGARGIRVLCIQPNVMPETRRLPTLAQVADVAAFLASDKAAAMTGTIANLTCGAHAD